jgi:hypothetical protein
MPLGVKSELLECSTDVENFYVHEHDPTYDEEPDPPELTGELRFSGDDFITDDWEEGYDYG